MKVAVVYFSSEKNQRLYKITTALAKGIESQGFSTDIIDARSMPDKKLFIYNYIAFGTDQAFISGDFTEEIRGFFSKSGPLVGKKCLAFIQKNIFGANKALLKLMVIMEKEGMLIKNSLIFKKADEAFKAGKKLHISS